MVGVVGNLAEFRLKGSMLSATIFDGANHAAQIARIDRLFVSMAAVTVLQ